MYSSSASMYRFLCSKFFIQIGYLLFIFRQLGKSNLKPKNLEQEFSRSAKEFSILKSHGKVKFKKQQKKQPSGIPFRSNSKTHHSVATVIDEITFIKIHIIYK